MVWSFSLQQHFDGNPFDGVVFAFRERKASQIKLISHDGVGFCLLTRRLKRGSFPWPPSGKTLIPTLSKFAVPTRQLCIWTSA
jgi:transposase